MRKSIFPLALLFITLNLFSQVEQTEAAVVNVVVPVLVFDGDKFVDDLKIDDFELYENGVIQKVEALYLADKTHITRAEELKKFSPQLARHFYLLFQLTDYDPKLAKALDFLFQKVLLPGDTLTIYTAVKPYALSPQALKTKPKELISKEMQGIVRKDTKIGASTYRSVLRDLQRLVSSMAGAVANVGAEREVEEEAMAGQGSSLEFLLPRYRSTLQKMEELRFVDQNKFLQFAKALKTLDGQKNVYLFYQREYRPELAPAIVNQIFSQYQDNPNIIGDMQDLFSFYHRYSTVDSVVVKQAFSDASVLFNLIFLDKEKENISGVYLKEQSEDIFRAFSDVAKATGGVVDTSQNPYAAFKGALDKSESYYILYYTPLDRTKDGKFRTIKVSVKGKDYAVKHRLGYYVQ